MAFTVWIKIMLSDGEEDDWSADDLAYNHGWTTEGEDTIPLRSNDEVTFHVPVYYLQYHSSIFRRMISSECLHNSQPIDLISTSACALSYVLDFMKSPSTYYTKPKDIDQDHPGHPIGLDEIEAIFEFAREYDCEHVTQAFGCLLDYYVDAYTAELQYSKCDRYQMPIRSTEYTRLFRIAAEGGFARLAGQVVQQGGCYGDHELEHCLPRSHMHPAAWSIDVSLRVPPVYYFALVKACSAAVRTGIDLNGPKSIDPSSWTAVSVLFLEQLALAEGQNPNTYKDREEEVEQDTGDW